MVVARRVGGHDHREAAHAGLGGAGEPFAPRAAHRRRAPRCRPGAGRASRRPGRRRGSGPSADRAGRGGEARGATRSRSGAASAAASTARRRAGMRRSAAASSAPRPAPAPSPARRCRSTTKAASAAYVTASTAGARIGGARLPPAARRRRGRAKRGSRRPAGCRADRRRHGIGDKGRQLPTAQSSIPAHITIGTAGSASRLAGMPASGTRPKWNARSGAVVSVAASVIAAALGERARQRSQRPAQLRRDPDDPRHGHERELPAGVARRARIGRQRERRRQKERVGARGRAGGGDGHEPAAP